MNSNPDRNPGARPVPLPAVRHDSMPGVRKMIGGYSSDREYILADEERQRREKPAASTGPWTPEADQDDGFAEIERAYALESNRRVVRHLALTSWRALGLTQEEALEMELRTRNDAIADEEANNAERALGGAA